MVTSSPELYLSLSVHTDSSFSSPETVNSVSLKFPPLFAFIVHIPFDASIGILKLSILKTPNLSENVSIF